jgi:DnaK suppressor protein
MKKKTQVSKSEKKTSPETKPSKKEVKSAQPESEVIILNKFSREKEIDPQKIAERLNKMKEEILSKMRARKAEWREAGSISPEPGDELDIASTEREREFDTILSSIDKGRLIDIEDALKKLKEGTYGICEECKAKIPRERLEMVPFARLCRECQERKDRDERIKKGLEEGKILKGTGFLDTSDEES